MRPRHWTFSRIAAALLAPALIGLAPIAVGPAPAAQAAGCAGTTGVTVVVDHNQLGGGVQSACVADAGGKVAWGTFEQAGFELTPVTRFPQAVCRVNGLPGTTGVGATSCADMPPAGAYWSLWWSDGKGGDWVYSSLGAASLKVPDGGLVAWSWQGQPDQSAPDFDPVRGAPLLRVTSPAGYRKAGSALALAAIGGGTLSGPGVSRQVTASGAQRVTLPAGTARRSYALTNSKGRSAATVSTLGQLRIPATLRKGRVDRGGKAVLRLRGLAATERIAVVWRGKRVYAGSVGASGARTVKVPVGRKVGSSKLKVTGQFPDIRKRTLKMKVTR